MRFTTLAADAGRQPDPNGVVSPPLQLAAAFAHHPSGAPLDGHIRASSPGLGLVEPLAGLLDALTQAPA